MKHLLRLANQLHQLIYEHHHYQWQGRTLRAHERVARIEYLIADRKDVRGIQVPQPAFSSSFQEIYSVKLVPFSLISHAFFLISICSSHVPDSFVSIMHQHF